jgi:phosphomannomutase
MPLLATHSGLRGRPGIDLTTGVLERALGGFVRLLPGRAPWTVAVARDDRAEGVALAAEVIAILRSRGAGVVDLGVVTTPGAKVAARALGCAGAVIVTGSHLAPEQNGLKLVVGPAFGPVDAGRLPDPAPPDGSPPAPGPLREHDGAALLHVDAICAAVDAGAIRAAGLAVACTGGAGAAATLLLDRLGCRATGRPDVTVHLDADADRVQLADESGVLLDAELTLPLVVLGLGARRVVRSTDTSRAVDAMARVHVVPPGELHLHEALVATGADLAGEGNGGVIVPAAGPGRDGLAAAALRGRA